MGEDSELIAVELKLSKLDHLLESVCEVSAARELLEDLCEHLVGMLPTYPESCTFVRVRKMENRPVSAHEVTYPPVSVSAGRANRAGRQLFYCQFWSDAEPFRSTLFPEIPNLAAGDRLAVSYWSVDTKFDLMPVGYVEQPEVYGFPALTSVQRIVKEFLSARFLKKSHAGQNKEYLLPAAIAEVFYDTPFSDRLHPMAGIMYPSVHLEGVHNLALLPHFVDRHLKMNRVEWIKIGSVEPVDKDGRLWFDWCFIDTSTCVDEHGVICWDEF
jgi:hypothetical protein